MQAKIIGELKRLTGIEGAQDSYKQVRPYHIVKSEKISNVLVSEISDDFTSPFRKSLSPDRLFNLSSGIPIDDEHAEGMLKIPEIGEQCCSDFIKERIFSDDTKFHDSLLRTKVKLFKQCNQKVSFLMDGKMKTVEVNPNIISTLLAASAKANQAIDFSLALEYPLSPVPLNIADADGFQTSTAKSKLNEIIMKKSTLIDRETEMPSRNEVSAYILDLMTLVRTQRYIQGAGNANYPSNTQRIPKSGYCCGHISKMLNKDPERLKRGCAERVIANSAVSRLPRDFNKFLQNSDNKTRPH